MTKGILASELSRLFIAIMWCEMLPIAYIYSYMYTSHTWGLPFCEVELLKRSNTAWIRGMVHTSELFTETDKGETRE